MTPLKPSTSARDHDHRRCVDTDLVGSRRIQFLGGLIWTISGALMAFNPPPPHAVHARRALPLPLLGWIAMVGGLYIAAQAVRTARVTTSGRPPRHSKKTTAAEAAKLVAAWVLGIAVGIGLLWWGKISGRWSLAGLGVGVLGPSVLMSAYVAAELKSAFGGRDEGDS